MIQQTQNTSDPEYSAFETPGIYMQMLKICFFTIILFTGFSACSKEKIVTEQKYLNESYGSHNRNKLDVFLPAKRDENTPFVLLIHGGAWVAGDKSDFRSFQQMLLQKGIASASMNYRYVSSDNHYQGLMDDVRSALNYCISKSEKWKIRNTKFVLAGASAGAHMALLYSYKYDPEGHVAAAFSAAGPTDFTEKDYMTYVQLVGLNDAVQKLTGHPYSDPPHDSYIAASPVTQIKNVPTLLIHGTADLVVFFSQSERLANRLEQGNVPYKFVRLQNAGHDLNIGNTEGLNKLRDELVSWAQQYSN